MLNYLREAVQYQFSTVQTGTYGIFGTVIFILVLAWSLVWKGMSLWRAARLGHRKWFIMLLIINTLGILEILYLFVFSKKVGKVEADANSKGL